MEVATFPVRRLDPSPSKQEAVKSGRAYQWVMNHKPAVQAMPPLVRAEFERRWVLAETIKTDLRGRWAEHNQQLRPPQATMARPRRLGLLEHDVEALGAGWWGYDPDGSWREAWQAQSRAFWEEYEEVNRRLIPDDPVYSGVLLGVTASTTVIWGEYKPAAGGQARVLESYFGGEATTSTVERIGVFVATTAGTTATAGTLSKMNSRSLAAGGAFNTAYSTQPTLPAQPLFVHAFNAFGGTDRWVPQPGEEAYSLGAGTAGEPVDWQPKAGTAVMSSHAMVEEL